MTRIDDLTTRMIGTMPLPAPESGNPRFSRVKLWAKAVLDNEAQDEAAFLQAKLPATLVRVDADPTVWTEASSAGWRFLSADNLPGAAGIFLDMWGKALQVPRYLSETDQPYARRIVDEVISPSTTNMGLAALIDRLLGMTGTRVMEGEGFFGSVRLNDGHRLNSGKRLMGFGAFGAESLWNTFIVVLPAPLPDTASEQAVIALIDRRRGAGNRLLAIVSDGLAPQVTAPDAVPVNQTYNARVIYPEGGATYSWTVTNGTITAGQNTTQITIQPAAEGLVQAEVTQTGGQGNGKKGSRNTTAVAAIITTLVIDATTAHGGETGHTASIPVRTGATYQWTVLNGFIVSGQGTNQITFGAGEADPILGSRVHVLCTVSLPGTAVQVQGEAYVDILPYPHTYTHVTASLAVGSTENYTVDMGKKWLVKTLASTIPARIRIYASDAQRAADASRPAGTKILGDPSVHGLLAEGVTTLDVLSIAMDEWAYAVTPLNAAYVSVMNNGTVASAITATISTQMNEA